MTDRPNHFLLVLIGPSGVGKSSVAEYLLLQHRIASYCVDAHSFELFLEDPQFRSAADRVGATGSREGLLRVLRELVSDRASENLARQEALHLLAARTALARAREPVIDFGSGHGSYEIESNQEKIAELLAPHPVLCLWPSRDIDRACGILLRRNRRNLEKTRESLSLYRGRDYAKHVVYVEERGIAEVAEEVLNWARGNSKG